MGVRYSRPIFQDAQGFMVHKESGIHALSGMAGRKLCTIDDTDNGPTALAALAAAGIRPIPFGFQEEGEMDAAIDDRHCEIASAMLSKLAEAREAIGNYAEISARAVGPGTALDLPRGLNALWNKGGIMAPQPLQ